MMEHEPVSAYAGLQSLTFGKALRRGATLSCPACGKGKLFRSMMVMNANCSDCNYRFERPAGYFLGSSYINYGVTAVTITVSYVALHFGLGFSNRGIMPGLLSFCAIFPLVFFRFARSLWLSFDCLFDRTGALEAVTGKAK